MAPKPDFAALKAAAAREMAAIRDRAAQDRAAVDGQVLKDVYERRGSAALTKRLEEMGRDRAARAAKTLGLNYDE